MTKSNTEAHVVPTLKDQLDKLPTKSAQIRYLHAAGYKRGAIAKALSEYHGKEVRYQHVRNVLITPVKKTDTL